MSDGVDATAAALAGGIAWVLAVFAAGIGATVITSWQTAVNWMGQFYVGYAPTLTGSVIGAVWGFFDIFIGVYVFLRLYNHFRDNPLF